MNTITIPRAMTEKDDLVIVPRKEYETLLRFRVYREVPITRAQVQALLRAERHMRSGKTLSYDTLMRRPAANVITYINMLSKSFEFLKDEPEIYSLSDVRKRYA